MSTVVTLERDPHATALALLPWYARGQLDAQEMDEVHAHLQACPHCLAELAAERALQDLQQVAGQAAPESGAGLGDVEAGLARMRSRIAAEGAVGERAGPRNLRGAPRWMAWALALQGGAVAALALLLLGPQGELPAYRGLSSAPAGSARALIMFKPEAREQQIREALQAGGASLVGGPTESRAYLLQLPREGRQQALQRLRAQPVVTLVESLETEPGQ